MCSKIVWLKLETFRPSTYSIYSGTVRNSCQGFDIYMYSKYICKFASYEICLFVIPSRDSTVAWWKFLKWDYGMHNTCIHIRYVSDRIFFLCLFVICKEYLKLASIEEKDISSWASVRLFLTLTNLCNAFFAFTVRKIICFLRKLGDSEHDIRMTDCRTRLPNCQSKTENAKYRCSCNAIYEPPVS